MKYRCLNLKSNRYKYYHGRSMGIDLRTAGMRTLFDMGKRPPDQLCTASTTMVITNQAIAAGWQKNCRRAIDDHTRKELPQLKPRP